MRKGTTKIPGKDDILAQLEAQRAKQAEQLKVEARARQELEDMLMRIERHFKVRLHLICTCGCAISDQSCIQSVPCAYSKCCVFTTLSCAKFNC